MEITVFNFKEHEVRTVLKDGEPWFVAKDVCEVLELEKTDSALRGLEEDEKGTHTVSTPGGNQSMSIISESGLYALIFKSRKPEAKTFRRWVTAEVLPAIRKTGGYIAAQKEETPEEILARALIVAKETIEQVQQRNLKLQAENESLKPKAAFADAVTASEGCILVRELAKLLKQGGLDIGGNFLFEVLRDTGYLIKQKSMDRDMPTQKAMEKGLFEVQEYLIPKKGGKKHLRRVTRVTPRGQRYFINKFLLTSFYLDYLKRRIEESKRKEREAKIELGEWHYNVAMKTGSLPEGDDAMQYIKMYMEETGKTPKDLVLRVAATVLDGFYPDVFSDKDTKQQ